MLISLLLSLLLNMIGAVIVSSVENRHLPVKFAPLELLHFQDSTYCVQIHVYIEGFTRHGIEGITRRGRM